MSIRHVFFDAGNTLVFPNFDLILEPLNGTGYWPSSEQLLAAERKAKMLLDSILLSDSHAQTDQVYWESFFLELLHGRPSATPLVAELVLRARTSAHWDRVLPGTREVLLQLRSEYLLGVISNSDGRIHQALERVGLADCFSLIVDSAVVGYRKPDPRIFQAALQKAGAEPSRSMYLGDIYSADYAASRKSGMQAVLMDVAGVYRETDYTRIDALGQLPAVLRAFDQ